MISEQKENQRAAKIEELEREPRIKKIAERTGFTKETVKKLLEEFPTYLLEENIEEGSYPLKTNPISELEQADYNKWVLSCLDRLSKREAQVIKLYFGLEVEKAYTIEEIGKITGIKEKAVKKAMDKALEKLRSYVEKEKR